MRNTRIKRIVVSLSCLLLVGSMLLFFAACGASSTPASPGGGTSTVPGYSLIGVMSHAIQAWWQLK